MSLPSNLSSAPSWSRVRPRPSLIRLAVSRVVRPSRNEPGEPHTITTRGIYNDLFVRTDAGWRFKHRKFTPAAFSTEGTTRVVRPAGP